jgi:hypothetical protein
MYQPLPEITSQEQMNAIDDSEKRFHAPETYIKIVITNKTEFNGHLFQKE